MNSSKNDIRKVFLGRSADEVDMVVISPIPSFYGALYNMLCCEEEFSNGFYRNASFKKGYTLGILICCSQGVSAQDVVYLFPNSRVIFVGYAGSLTEKISIGTPIEVEEAILDSNESYHLVCNNLFQKAEIAYSPCFLGKMAENALLVASQWGATVVDMETVYCAKAAHYNNCDFSAFLVITDIPNNIDVWSLDERDKDNVNKGVRLMLTSIYDKIL